MNGWKRSFVVLSVILILPTLAVWLGERPKVDDSLYVAGCEYPTYVTPAQAAAALGGGTYRDYNATTQANKACASSLGAVVDGTEYQRAKERWTDKFMPGATFLAILLGIIYSLGWAVGWIWRGFFPKKV